MANMSEKVQEKSVVAKDLNDILTTTIITKPEDKKAILKRKIDAQREKDKTPVRGIFRNIESPGSALRFSYFAYKGDSVQTYDLQDETVYTLPHGVAKHLNQNCWYPVHAHTLNEAGMPTISISKKMRRFNFSPLGFMDESDFNVSDIVIARPL